MNQHGTRIARDVPLATLILRISTEFLSAKFRLVRAIGDQV